MRPRICRQAFSDSKSKTKGGVNLFRAIFAEKFYQKNCTKIAASFRSGIVLTVLVLSILLGPQFALAYDVMAGGQSLGIVLKS